MRLGLPPALLVLLVCCASTKINVVDMGSGLKPLAKPENCTVPIFRTQKPSEPYHELATIESIGAAATSSETVHEDFKKTACKLGADALIISDLPAEKPGCGGYSGPSVKGVAIVYRRPTGPAEPAPPTSPSAQEP